MHHRILIALLAAGMLSACGQKGPLYLPADDGPAEVTDAAPLPGTAAASGSATGTAEALTEPAAQPGPARQSADRP